eukprot:764429-Prymnesium_polylepis.2
MAWQGRVRRREQEGARDRLPRVVRAVRQAVRPAQGRVQEGRALATLLIQAVLSTKALKAKSKDETALVTLRISGSGTQPLGGRSEAPRR